MNLADAYHAFYMAVLVCLSVLTLFCLFRAIQGPAALPTASFPST